MRKVLFGWHAFKALIVHASIAYGMLFKCKKEWLNARSLKFSNCPTNEATHAIAFGYSQVLRASNESHQVSSTKGLIHLLDQRIDLVLPIPQITTLDKMLELPRPEATRGIRQLERPQEVARLLEVGPHNHNFMHQILHTDDAEFAQVLLDDLVISEGNPLLVHLPVSSLVDKVADGFYARVPIGNVRFDDFEHFGSSFGEFDEDAVVDLEETEELHYFTGFRGHFVDTESACQRGRWAMDRVRVRQIYPLMRTTKTSLGSPGT